MALKTKIDIDFDGIKEQFVGLNGRHPGLWPSLPKSLLLAGIFTLIVVFAYFFYWQGLVEELDAGRAREVQLKDQYRDKMRQAVNLEVLRKQKEQVAQYVGQLEKQLPSKAEMDALLSDINQAGVGRGLQFELFKPGQVLVKEYYAELPIDIRLAGNYHDLGAFTSDISNLARIVTLENMKIEENEKTGRLAMQAVAKTYRYLDQEEIAEQRRQAAAAAQAKAGGRK
ncbi:MAG: type 4a pilus biogenesis protein PilO [Burkholderiaceae bacterium]|jgi:type IV pilus assembly protein PilO|nr:type 4a pilus biogenesis protein PilO [Burkholderiaceae bacterium]MEB2320077.1 type 4a pilus biogenesis protein PilO [Pseudomonadota bacterium]